MKKKKLFQIGFCIMMLLVIMFNSKSPIAMTSYIGFYGTIKSFLASSLMSSFRDSVIFNNTEILCVSFFTFLMFVTWLQHIIIIISNKIRPLLDIA